jgi:tetratricopeptide (TPR) repeat protein
VACPDNTDTPQIIEYTVGNGYRAFRQNPANALPSCYIAAVGRNDKVYSDSVVTMTLAMSDALIRRNASDPANLSGRIALLTRARRYREVPATFDQLLKLDTAQGTLVNYRLALAAALRGGDTTARVRYLTAAARKYPQAQSIVADYNIQRQIPRLHAMIDSMHQILRLAPSRTGAYATLASIYGNLDVPDSAIAYTKKALAAGVPRNDVAPSLQSLIGVVMRKAQLLDSPDTWQSTLPLARAIDSALSTDASKHLLALTLVQVAAVRIDGIKDALRQLGDEPATAGGARARFCTELTRTMPMLDEAEARLAAGGSRFSVESVPAIKTGVSVLRGERIDLSKKCPG